MWSMIGRSTAAGLVGGVVGWLARSLLTRGIWTDVEARAREEALQLALAEAREETRRHAVEIAALRALLATREAELQEKGRLLAERDIALAARDAALSERDQRLLMAASAPVAALAAAPGVAAAAPAAAAPAAAAEEDDLKEIPGIGPVLARRLGELGVRTFRQIALWTDADVLRIEDHVKSFKGRIRREGWIGHARKLHKKKYHQAP